VKGGHDQSNAISSGSRRLRGAPRGRGSGARRDRQQRTDAVDHDHPVDDHRHDPDDDDSDLDDARAPLPARRLGLEPDLVLELDLLTREG
jgi:hypothetical protein